VDRKSFQDEKTPKEHPASESTLQDKLKKEVPVVEP